MLSNTIRAWFSSLWVVLFVTNLAVNAEQSVYEFRMPGVRTHKNDAYLCYAEDFQRNMTFVTGFEPLHDKEVTHHMILFSCEEPGSEKEYWLCDGTEGSSPVCKSGMKIIFSWAMEAPSFKLPPETSLPIGGPVNRFLVLQVHYKDSKAFDEKPEKKDRSGFRMTISTEPTKYVGGVYLFASNQDIPANANSSTGVACTYTGRVILHPFAFRVHAHSHGVVNEGFVIHHGKRFLIGAKSPQEPQTFYPTTNGSLMVYPGDLLMARCNMTNNENRVIRIGHTRQDEMCNFYMMYSVPLQDMDQLNDENNQDCNTDFRPMDQAFDKFEDDFFEPILHEVDESYFAPHLGWGEEDEAENAEEGLPWIEE